MKTPFDISHLSSRAQRDVLKCLRQLDEMSFEALTRARTVAVVSTNKTPHKGLLTIRPSHSVRLMGRMAKHLSVAEFKAWGTLLYGEILITWVGTHEGYNKLNFADPALLSPAKLASEKTLPTAPDGAIVDRVAGSLLGRDLTIIRRLLNDNHLNEAGEPIRHEGRPFRFVKVDDVLRAVAKKVGSEIPEDL